MNSPRQQKITITPVILAGGGGTRLWPLSTHAQPKQFHQLAGTTSLLQQTLQRFARHGVNGADRPRYAPPLVVTSNRYAAQVRDQARQVGCNNIALLLEPCPRNTAPAIAAAAVWLGGQSSRRGEDATMLVLPADHHIADPAALHAHVAQAMTLACDGALVTFGIVPTRAETGYGYIRQGKPWSNDTDSHGFRVAEFIEKPDRQTAEHYLAQGGFFWNAGIFLFSANAVIRALGDLAPDILGAARSAVAKGQSQHASLTLGAEEFARCPALPIDVAVMEQANNVAVVPATMGWADIGSWEAVAQVVARDSRENFSQGQVLAIDTNRCHLRTDAGLLATVGVSDLVVVRSNDVVLVCQRQNTQATKQAQATVAALRANDVAPGEPLALQAQAERVKAWLGDTALPLWADAGWDAGFDGFHEYLTPQGKPPLGAVKRLRVQARQIFVYARAASLGLAGHRDREQIDTALATMIARGWQAEGGWLHEFTHQGGAHDTRRDAYDHAFVLLSLAWVYRTTGSAQALTWARRTLAYLDAVLADPENGGYFEAAPAQLPRRANPHMHLLEALLALFDATGDYSFLDRASAIVGLFKTRFFDPESGSVGEFFDTKWRPATGPAGRWREPGHNYEWASLLAIYAYKAGEDCSTPIAQLHEFAETRGLAPQTGLAFDQTLEDGTVSDPHHRLWPQTEALRASVLMARHGLPGATGRAAALVDAIFEYFLDPAPAGLWIDRIDQTGKPACGTVPASTLYHLVVAFSAVIEATRPGAAD